MTPNAIWYSELTKPFFAPPASVFGPVWTVVYIIIAITYIWVIVMAIRGKFPTAVVIPFILNLAFNFMYSPIQFQFHNNYLASIDILLVLATLIWSITKIWPHSKALALAQVPYLLWIIFATVLQISITWLNAFS